MLYICIPVHDEAPTIGVLLWRIRGALQELTREYEIVVYDDGSTDVTPEVLEPYEKVVPLTVLRGARRQGYAHAVDQLARFVAERTPYPRRDAMVLMQGDFTDRPEDIPDLLKRFEAGADVVVTERHFAEGDPTAARRFGRAARWALRPFVKLDGVAELTSTYRLIRIAALRDLLRERGDRPLLSAPDTASANAELLMALRPHVRRIESIAVTPRYDARVRLSRIRPLADAWTLARFAWRSRGGSLPTAPIATRVATRVATSPQLHSPVVRAIGPADAVDSIAGLEAGLKGPGRGRVRRPRGDGAEGNGLGAPSNDSVLDPSKRRSRSRRKKRGSGADGGVAALDDASESRNGVAELSSDDPSAETLFDAQKASGAGAIAEQEVSDESETSPGRARRSRRGRKRRRASASEGQNDADDSAGADAQGSGADDAARDAAAARFEATDGADTDGDAAESDGDAAQTGAPRARRSRRGRRRGRRPTSTDAPAGEPGGEGVSGATDD